jgi:hypothetical protein
MFSSRTAAGVGSKAQVALSGAAHSEKSAMTILSEIGGQYTYLIPCEDQARFILGILSPEFLEFLEFLEFTQGPKCLRG